MESLKISIKNHNVLTHDQKEKLLQLVEENKIAEVFEDGSYKLSDEEIKIREIQFKKDVDFIEKSESQLESISTPTPYYNGDPSIDGYVFCINRSGVTIQVYSAYTSGVQLAGRAIYPNECFMARPETMGEQSAGPIYFLGPNGAMEYGFISVGRYGGHQTLSTWNYVFYGVENFGRYVTSTTKSLPTRDSIDLYTSSGSYLKSIPSGYRVIVDSPCRCGYSNKYMISIKGYLTNSNVNYSLSCFANTGIRSGSMYNTIDIYPEL